MENNDTTSLNTQHKTPTKKRSLMVTQIFVVSLAVIIVILLTAYFFYGYQQRRAARIKHAEMESIALLKEDQVRSWLRERESDADFFYHNSEFAKKTIRLAADPSNRPLVQEIESELTTFRKNHEYRNIFLIDNERELLADIRDENSPPNTFSWDRDMDTVRSLLFRDFYLDTCTQKPSLAFWIPYFKNPGDSMWTTMLVIRIDPEMLLYPLLATWPNKSRTSETVLIRKDGDSIVYLNNLRFEQNSAMRYKLPLSRNDLPAVKAVTGFKGILEGKDYRDVPVLADTRKVSGTPWFMVNKIDQDEVYADLDQTFTLVVLWVVGLILLFAVIMIIRGRSNKMKHLAEAYRSELRALESEKALKNLSRRKNALLNTMPDLVWIKDTGGTYIEVNSAFTETFGIAEDNIIGKTDADLWDAAEAQRARSTDSEVMQAKETKRFVYSINDRSGSLRWMDAVKSLITDESGETIGLIGVARDITTQVEKEEEIKNLNRIYATLSEINQTVIRAKDKEKLFADVCRIAVDYGKFCLAWLAKESKNAGLPVALGSHGIMESQVQAVAINYVSVKILDPKIQQKLNKGEYYICNDIEEEGSRVLPEGTMTGIGFASYAVLPLLVNGALFASLVLYSEKKECFNDKEMQLLTELSGDIAFAIEYMQQEEMRREAVDKFQLSFMNAPMGICLTSTEGRFLQANDALSRMLGYRNEELMDLPLTTVTHPDDRNKSMEWMAELLSGAKSIRNSAEKRYITKTGEVVWADITTSLMFDKQGKPLYFITVIQNITDRIRNAEKLRQSTQMLQLAQRIARIGSWTYDYNACEFELSDDMCEMTGLARDAKPGQLQGAENEQWPLNTDKLAVLMKDAVDAAREFNQEFALSLSGGTTRYIQVQGFPLKNDTGTVVRFFGAVQDITDRVRMEEQARSERDQLKMIMNSYPYGVYIVNREYEVEYVNPMIVKEYGAVGGKKCYEYLHGASRPCIWCRSKEVFDGKSFTWEWTSERNGKTYEVFDTLLKNTDGSLSKLEIFFDITQRKRAENEIIHLNQELEYRVEDRTTELVAYTKELEAFSYSVSHDLRAPLRAIHGFGNALIEDYGPQLDETAMGYLQRMSKGVERMSGLIDDLLKLSMITRKEVHFEDIDITAMAHEVAETLAIKEKSNLVIDEKLNVCGDRGLVRIALENIIGNAYKYSSKGNTPEIRIGLFKKDDREYIYVKDNGVGFDMEYAHKLFTPFQRLHSDAEFKGTGIGLAIVQRIINKHGGEIWVESAVGSGSSFYFRFSENKPVY